MKRLPFRVRENYVEYDNGLRENASPDTILLSVILEELRAIAERLEKVEKGEENIEETEKTTTRKRRTSKEDKEE